MSTIAALAAIPVVAGTNLGVPGVAFGVLLVLALPGYALSSVIFRVSDLTAVERLLASVALSIAVVILTGFGLNLMRLPLSRGDWAVSLLIVTVALSAIAWRLMPVKPPADIRRGLSVQRVREISRARPLRRSDLALVGLAGVSVVVAIAIARVGAANAPTETFTQLWMVPTDGNAVRIGVSNHEAFPMTYNVVLTGDSIALLEWPSIQLGVGAEWTAELPLPASTPLLELDLYRADQPDVVYRKVVWGPGPSPSPRASG